MNDLERAIAFAAEAHSGQVDMLGEPYIDHCLRVMDAVSSPAKRVAVLHDVCGEDRSWTEVRVSDWLGLSHAEGVALMLLTRSQVQTYGQYIEGIADSRVWGSVGAPVAREVKVADLRDNLGRWTPELGEDLKRRYERALERLTKEKTT